jgi:hypothetical protein
MAARVACASKRGITTRWAPARSAVHDQTTGPLWYSGPGMSRQPSGSTPSVGRASGSSTAGSPETMSFGRPVEPPEVGAFQAGEVTSGSGPSSMEGWGTWPAGRQSRPGTASGSDPTTSRASASSTIACSSDGGRR